MSSNNDAPLYHKYPKQTSPQPAFIELDLKDGSLDADWNPVIGNAVPGYVYYGYVRRYSVDNCLSSKEVEDLIEKLRPLAKRVAAGYESIWDGHNNVAVLNDDAKDAEDEIQEICYRAKSHSKVWDVDEWLSNCSLDEIWPEDTSLEDAADYSRDVRIAGGIENVRQAIIDVVVRHMEGSIKAKRLVRPDQVRELLELGELDDKKVAEWALAVLDDYCREFVKQGDNLESRQS